MQLQGAPAVRLRRHDPSKCVRARIVCVVCLYIVFCVPRHQEIREVLREARRSGQSSVAPRRRADWSGLVCPFRCNVVAGGAGGGTFRSLVLQRNEVRDLREHRDCSQFLRGICSVKWKRAFLNVCLEEPSRGPTKSAS